jgi:hypothetical protein
MTYQVIDNFLDTKDFQKVKEAVYGPFIPWFHNQFLVRPDYTDINDLDNWQLTHTFYKNYSVTSEFFNVLDPILTKLNPSAILRIKANLIPKTHFVVQHQMHVDVTCFKGKTAVFYINSNDGHTVFEDGTRVESVENRIVIFDAITMHTGTSCTNARNRVVINFNYYPWDT